MGADSEPLIEMQSRVHLGAKEISLQRKIQSFRTFNVAQFFHQLLNTLNNAVQEKTENIQVGWNVRRQAVFVNSVRVPAFQFCSSCAYHQLCTVDSHENST
jgi:hypothetical protein